MLTSTPTIMQKKVVSRDMSTTMPTIISVNMSAPTTTITSVAAQGCAQMINIALDINLSLFLFYISVLV